MLVGTLSGQSVVVAGAGLAGLTAARDLLALGADVTVVDARDRVGGRVWTIRDGFAERQHAEAGGDMIDESQDEIKQLAGELGLKLTRILRGGFGYVRADASGVPQIAQRDASRGWARLGDALKDVSRAYKLAERRWDTPITSELARQSVASWLDAVKADQELRATARGLRGFFLADPEDLSLVALVDQFSEDDGPAIDAMYRIEATSLPVARLRHVKMPDVQAPGMIDRCRMRRLISSVKPLSTVALPHAGQRSLAVIRRALRIRLQTRHPLSCEPDSQIQTDVFV